jgi:Cu(I)/Ag(I) efflux system membrane fusion protein/cobalt-zinc-cadmium efflux system membrane fusion protein
MTTPVRSLLLIITAALLPAGPMIDRSFSGEAPARAEELSYTCGMHPMIVIDEPGLCPLCQMDLTPLKAGTGGTGDQVIVIDPVTSQKMGIRTALAVPIPLVQTIRTVGLVGYEEPGQTAVNAKISGWVDELMINQSGQEVRKGQPLLSLYSPELVAAQKELLIALKSLREIKGSGFPDAEEDARSLLDSARRRLELWDISPEQIKRLERSGRVERNLTLLSPAEGIVSKKKVRKGEYVQAGAELMEISSLKKVWVYADIYEDEIPWVKVGQGAEVKFPFSSESVSGPITQLYPYLDAATRTVKARIELDNDLRELKPDMYADVTIRTAATAPVLTIPVEAVLFSGVRERVFLALGDGKFEPREVRTGLQDENGNIEIVSGLVSGDRVVTSAQFMLDSESKLREALQKMLNPEPAAASQKEELDDLF